MKLLKRNGKQRALSICLTNEYHQVGVIRAAHKGCKSWNPPEAQKGLRAASLGIPASTTLGSMFVARFSANLKQKIDLTNAFKAFFATILVSHAAKSLDTLGNSAWGAWGGVREKLRDARLETCRGP